MIGEASMRRRRVAARTDAAGLVREGALPGVDLALPLVLQPAVADVDLPSWVAARRAWLEARLLRHGAILFRGFPVADAADFGRVMEAFGGDLLEYGERSSPRVAVHGRVYTSTEYPSEQAICLHNENSYQHAWPLKLGFFCLEPPTTGGETPIADVRRVFERLDPDVRERFARRRVLYVRNYRHGVGLPWSTVFQTTDPDAVDAYCRDAGIETRWWPDGRLRTRQVRHAVVRHPQTGEPVWFNHAAFFHVTSLPAAVRAALLQSFAEDELPTQTYFGDGGAIDQPLLDHVRAAYRAETVTFPWERGDLLLLDNMLVAHARAPYTGPRRILVAMAERVDAAEVATP